MVAWRPGATPSGEGNQSLAKWPPGALLPAPARRALTEKRPDALLRVRRQSVHRHHLLGVGVGFRLIEIDLRVEGLLADAYDQRTGGGHLFREAAGTGLQFSGGNSLVDQAPLGGDAGRY